MGISTNGIIARRHDISDLLDTSQSAMLYYTGWREKGGGFEILCYGIYFTINNSEFCFQFQLTGFILLHVAIDYYVGLFLKHFNEK